MPRGKGYSKRKAPKKSVKPPRSTSAGRKQAKQASTSRYTGRPGGSLFPRPTQAPVKQTPKGKETIKVRTSSPPATTAPPSRGRRSMGD